ncbi:MAG: hypothetical protein K940chlam9_01853, partial [Chlamydiae bacterium]|nr:hypothetical protein [Chlamydiota bacterium]
MWEGVQQILDQGNRFLITTHLH